MKRALNPLMGSDHPFDARSRRFASSAREQIVNTNIEHEEETYIRVGGLLHSFVTLKDLPDATFPGILRDLVGLDFPITVNTEVTIPDQAAMIKHYKSTQDAGRPTGFARRVRIDVDAQVAQRQLMETSEQLISRLLQDLPDEYGHRCPHVATGAEPSRSGGTGAGACGPASKVLYTVMQMNGSRGLQEDLAKRRLFIGGLPGMGEENQRENDCLTLHAADLLPVETSWRGMPQSPLILLETPHGNWCRFRHGTLPSLTRTFSSWRPQAAARPLWRCCSC